MHYALCTKHHAPCATRHAPRAMHDALCAARYALRATNSDKARRDKTSRGATACEGLRVAQRLDLRLARRLALVEVLQEPVALLALVLFMCCCFCSHSSHSLTSGPSRVRPGRGLSEYPRVCTLLRPGLADFAKAGRGGGGFCASRPGAVRVCSGPWEFVAVAQARARRARLRARSCRAWRALT